MGFDLLTIELSLLNYQLLIRQRRSLEMEFPLNMIKLSKVNMGLSIVESNIDDMIPLEIEFQIFKILKSL